MYTLHTFKRTLVSLAFLLLVVPISGICSDANGRYVVQGLGADSCGKFVEGTRERREYYTTWVTGYLTAINAVSPMASDILGNTDIDGAVLSLENYCRINPLRTFGAASDALVKELYPKRTTQVRK
jgi:hypothetical protein